MEKRQHLKEDNLKRLYTAWFQLASILGKAKTRDIIFLKRSVIVKLGACELWMLGAVAGLKRQHTVDFQGVENICMICHSDFSMCATSASTILYNIIMMGVFPYTFCTNPWNTKSEHLSILWIWGDCDVSKFCGKKNIWFWWITGKPIHV